jgi:hypothetical protein
MTLQELENIGKLIKKNYNNLYKENKSFDKQNINSIIESINNNLAELSLSENQINIGNNINQETLLKQEKILKMENDKLMHQLVELKNIESAISNKNKIIEQTNLNIEEQETNIKVLITMIVFSLILFIAVMLYGYRIIKPKILIFIFFILVVLFFIIYIYSYNIFYFYDVIQGLFGNGFQRLENEIINQSESIDKNLRTGLYGDEKVWEDNNCDCPLDEETDISYASDNNSSEMGEKIINGFYYYDGSAPQQLLVPLPPSINDQDESKNYNKIDWVDYSKNGTIPFNNYYNKNNQNDPKNILREKLDKSINLVNYQTNTSSL